MSFPNPERKSLDEPGQFESCRSSRDTIPLSARVDSGTPNESGTSPTFIPVIVVVPEISRQTNIGETLSSHDDSVVRSARRKIESLRFELSTHLLDAEQQSAISGQLLQENITLEPIPAFSANEARKAVESSESSPSGPPSRKSVPSSSFPVSREPVTRARESIDGVSPGYLLTVAAKAAERQLREQALAAFLNDDHHQPVHHYIDQRDILSGSCSESQYDSEIGKRASELKETQQHDETLDAERDRDSQERNTLRRIVKQPDETPWAMPVLALQDGVDSGSLSSVPVKEDDEMEKMRKKARPPMLGGDIDFPRCSSPDQARFDVTQGSEYLRQTMCYLTQAECEPEDGLWSPLRSQASQTSLWSRSSSRAPSKGGLWGGSCVDTGFPSCRGPTGIMTPCHEVVTFPESGDCGRVLRQLPPSPPPSNPDMATPDEQLDLDQTMEVGFDDTFVTQVYNYLSIGYPAIAHDFDEELSKISGISIRELRQDDDLPCARGYIRLGDGERNEEGVTEDNCLRWKAMRIYVQEWAKQQPTMAKSASSLNIGLNAAKRGSWAL